MVDFCNTITDYPTATGVMSMLFSIRDCVPLSFPALLLTMFFVLFAGNYFLIKGKTGRAKVLIALSTAAFVNVILTMFLTLAMLVTYKLLLMWTLISIMSFIGLIISDNQ